MARLGAIATSCCRGEIYWVDFATPRGSEQGGRRPALIIQNNTGNKYSTTAIVAAITAEVKAPYRFHVEISAAESGLAEDSTVLLEQLLTVSKTRLSSLIGRLLDSKMKEIDNALRISLSL